MIVAVYFESVSRIRKGSAPHSRHLHNRVHARARNDRDPAVSTLHRRNEARVRSRLRLLCQAAGGPRARTGNRSNRSGSVAATDQGKLCATLKKIVVAGAVGMTNMPARFVLLQIAQ